MCVSFLFNRLVLVTATHDGVPSTHEGVLITCEDPLSTHGVCYQHMGCATTHRVCKYSNNNEIQFLQVHVIALH